MGPIEIILIVLLLVVVGVVGWGLSAYNGFIRQRNLIQESWRQVDVELNRRYELIPNLVETVRAYAAHERNTLEEITRLRNQAASMSQQSHGDTPSPQRAEVESQLTGAVHNLLVSVEAYPDLKSNQNFLALQSQLEGTENRIAVARRDFIQAVQAYNTEIRTFPGRLWHSVMYSDLPVRANFEATSADADKAPQVKF